MRIIKENIKDIDYFQGFEGDLSYCKSLLVSLLTDLDELNQMLEDNGENYRKLYIEYIDSHTEWSAERTEPCPDYYGMFKLVFEKNPYECVGEPMNVLELDNAMLLLINFVEFKLS